MLFLICGSAALLIVVYYALNIFKADYSYFKKRGIPQLPTEFFFGNYKDHILKKKNRGQMFSDFYFKFKKLGATHGGVYDMKGVGKTWMPVDKALVKNVLVKDFVYFSAHNQRMPGLFFNNLFHMDGEEWKDMRRKLTPTFTSGKMKMMFEIIQKITLGLSNRMDQVCKLGGPINIQEILVRFTIDIIANCAFGIESNAIENINSEFYKQVIKSFGGDIGDGDNKPKKKKSPFYQFILRYLGSAKRIIPDFKAIEDFFREVVRETLNYREENRIIRKDFIHLMIQLKNKGSVFETTNGNEDVFKKTVETEVMSFEDIAGECLLFLAAGFGTTSTTMSFAMLELAHNPDVQEKLRKEVKEVLQRHNGKLTYEALQEMKYCENVIHETLRMYPTLPGIFRLCTKDYKIPGTNSIIEKGTNVYVSALGLHRDPDHFPNPDKFIPERFNIENKNTIQDYSFLPFGEGPRMCLGLRFGMMQSKAGLSTLINKCTFTLNNNTPYPPIMSMGETPSLEEEKIWLNAVKLD